MKNKNDLALLKVTSPKTEEPVTSSSNSSQHLIFCALYFCRTSLRLGECAFFVPFHLGFSNFNWCMDTHTNNNNKKKHEGRFGSKQCHTLHHHYKCSSVKKPNFETMKFLIHKVISTLVHIRLFTVTKALLLRQLHMFSKQW